MKISLHGFPKQLSGYLVFKEQSNLIDIQVAPLWSIENSKKKKGYNFPQNTKVNKFFKGV